MGKVKKKPTPKKAVKKQAPKKSKKPKVPALTPAPIDVIALVDLAEKRRAQKKKEVKGAVDELVQKQKQHATLQRTGLKTVPDKLGNGSKVVDSHGKVVSVTAPITDSLEGDYKELKKAKLAAKEESKAHRNAIYINTQSDGSFNISTKWKKAESVYAYKNGSEVEPKDYKTEKSKQIINEIENQNNMATTKTAKKVAGKVPAKKVQSATKKADKSIPGIKKDMKVKDIMAAIKKGSKFRNHLGSWVNPNIMGARPADQIRTVYLQK